MCMGSYMDTLWIHCPEVIWNYSAAGEVDGLLCRDLKIERRFKTQEPSKAFSELIGLRPGRL